MWPFLLWSSASSMALLRTGISSLACAYFFCVHVCMCVCSFYVSGCVHMCVRVFVFSLCRCTCIYWSLCVCVCVSICMCVGIRVWMWIYPNTRHKTIGIRPWISYRTWASTVVQNRSWVIHTSGPRTPSPHTHLTPRCSTQNSPTLALLYSHSIYTLRK